MSGRRNETSRRRNEMSGRRNETSRRRIYGRNESCKR